MVSAVMFTLKTVINVRGGVGGMVSPRESVVQSAYQYDVTSRVGDFQNGEQSVHHCNEFLSIV